MWVYEARPDVHSIIHTHSPWASALAAAREPLVISQMDMTPLHNDCAFLGEWPGVPIAADEGVLISKALGSKRAINPRASQLSDRRQDDRGSDLSVGLPREGRPDADQGPCLRTADSRRRHPGARGARLSAAAFHSRRHVRILVPSDPGRAPRLSID
ncbi:class II aldolase/adducin family protein [Bradyrhizobium sp. 134]|uniref:class II aldolase/adducin family protein n=1 Tax=unclassified Bradyrhizobium TaxID=2631580 RepID=UPI00320952A7